MADLVLGPMLRYVDSSAATVWVETDEACEVEILGVISPTFQVDGHHYALVELTGLKAGASYEYTVTLDGRQAWPQAGSQFPPSVIRTHEPEGEVRVVFGSCRVSLPHEPPYSLEEPEHELAQGVDALRTLALRAIEQRPEDRPHCLIMLGDQIYADDLSPAMLEVTRNRDEQGDAPSDELGNFHEYTLAYREAWSEPVVRWFFSTVSTSMIFDDHEIHAEWKISEGWLEEMRAKSWFDRRIADGLMAYWLYQHLGNLSINLLRETELYDRVRAADDAGDLLRQEMSDANDQTGHSRWSWCRDLGKARLLAIDSRANRDLAPGNRRILDGGEWDWIAARAKGDFDHLLLASSVPFFLPKGLHYSEAWAESVAEGAWGDRMRPLGEKVRRAAVMDHWASFQRSFHSVVDLLEDAATGKLGEAPASIVMLSGDIHHCYVSEIGFKGLSAAERSPVWQCVCSAYRKQLSKRDKQMMKFGNSWVAGRIATFLARSVGIDERIGLRLTGKPNYENQVGTLTLAPGCAHVRIETTAGADWESPTLSPVFEQQLAGRASR